MNENQEPEVKLPGVDKAHSFVDFLWDRVHISAGALVLIIMGFLFTVGVHKIDSSNTHKTNQAIAHIQANDTAICHLVAGANANIGQQRQRIQQAIGRDLELARAADHTVRALRRIPAQTVPKPVARGILEGWIVQAKVNRSAARDLKKQVAAVKIINLPGCS